MSKANQEMMAKIHEKLAKRILAKLDDPECTPQDFAQAIKFLKDNNVIADPELNADLQKINDRVNVQTLPFPVKEQ